jgi:hypothetical protein
MFQCSACDEWKQLTEFYKVKNNSLGHSYKCKACCREYTRNKYWENPEAQRTRKRREYWRNPEHARARVRNQYRKKTAYWASRVTAMSDKQKIYDIVTRFIGFCAEHYTDAFWDYSYEWVDDGDPEGLDEVALPALQNIRNILTVEQVAEFVEGQQEEQQDE